jgi:hypothetical protein
MIRSLVLFVHIAGVLALFAGLALEAFGVEAARKAAPRISGIAMAVTVVAGFYLGARFGVLRNEWLLARWRADRTRWSGSRCGSAPHSVWRSCI